MQKSEYIPVLVPTTNKYGANRCQGCIFFNQNDNFSNCQAASITSGYDCFGSAPSPLIHGKFKLMHRLTEEIVEAEEIVRWWKDAGK